MRVAIVGRGKVGSGLHRALRAAHVPTTITSAKDFASKRSKKKLVGDVVIVAARDGAIPEVARAPARTSRSRPAAASAAAPFATSPAAA